MVLAEVGDDVGFKDEVVRVLLNQRDPFRSNFRIAVFIKDDVSLFISLDDVIFKYDPRQVYVDVISVTSEYFLVDWNQIIHDDAAADTGMTLNEGRFWKRLECINDLAQVPCAMILSVMGKPNAFENYRYRDDLFPTSRFRMAYDDLCERHTTSVASRQYLRILQLAARESETRVDDALRLLHRDGVAVSDEQVERLLREADPAPPVTEVAVDEPDLVSFDCLLEEQEVLDGCETGCERDVDWPSQGIASANVP